uniref:Uncharacterized protein n=1 Tax=Oncorhynchus tshawytscha TaxID=74940 RepID=A0AAZ3Q740_ONCTS
MSLSDQSRQCYPTSVQVTVVQARSLRIKGRNGTNDAYAIMQVAKDKFATSVAENSVAPVWKEEATFELPLFYNGNTEKCTLHVHVMHRALVGPDKLLGQAVINLLELSEVKSRYKTEPHPVKPLSSLENQPASNIQERQAGISTGILGVLQEKIKVKDTGVKVQYSQLTQEELISLVVKQQDQLSKRDNKIKELEQYIDNLLVRIIEEQPSILMSMNSLK